MSSEEVSFIVGGVALAVSLIAILPMMTTKRKWLAAISLIIGVVFILHGFYRMANRDQITPENSGVYVKKWLETFNATTTNIPDPKLHFRVKVSFSDNTMVAIFRSKERPRYLVFQGVVALSPELKASFSKLSKQEQEQFFEEFRLEMAKARILGEVNLAQFDNIKIVRLLPITNDLTEATVLDRLDEIHADVTIVVDTLLLRLGQKPPPS